jgi:predicted enzyme related to lactoylglutathione lyase
MFSGVRSVVYFSNDLSDAAEWYEHILGIAPYRNEENFVGFHLEDYDLCLHPVDEKAASDGAAQVMYWIIDDLETTIADLMEEGCTIYRDMIEVPEGGRVAELKDPFGNILGLSETATPQTPNQ